MTMLRSVLSALALLSVAGPLGAQDACSPRANVRLGVGTTFGGLGLQGELFPGAAPVSLLAAAGFGPLDGADNFKNATFAVATRVYFGGPRRPGFVELAYSPLAADQVADPVTGISESATLYGLGLQVGGQVPLGIGGVHLIGGVGAGYATTANVVASRWRFISQLGLGYAFGRRRAAVP